MNDFTSLYAAAQSLSMYQGRRRRPKPAPPAERPPRHARWVAIYKDVRTLQAQGMPIATMARQLGISRPAPDNCNDRHPPAY